MDIQLENIIKEYKYKTIGPLDVTFKKGFVTGIVGGNGAGKSTLIRMLLSIVEPSSGTIMVGDRYFMKEEKNIKERIGFVLQEDASQGDWTVEETKQMIAPFYSAWDDELFYHYCGVFDLPLHQPVKKFSTGMKQKMNFILAISHHPEFLILDEPTAGVDPKFRKQFLDILRKIVAEEQTTILIVTHLISDLEEIADYLLIMEQGKIVLYEDTETLKGKYAIVQGEESLLDKDTKKYFEKIIMQDGQFEGLSSSYIQVSSLFEGEAIV